MADEIALAIAIVDMRTALTDEIMRPIMALMNTDLGFRCDKDYDIATVRDVVIEAKMRGFRIVGNEFNIIAKRFYAAQKGFRRKLTDGFTFRGLSDLRDEYSVPAITGDKATVKAKATWKINGEPDSCEQEFAIRVNAGMGSDAVIGKAERKLLKRVHDIISGANTPDGDVDDLPMRNVTPNDHKPHVPFKRAEAQAAPMPEPAVTHTPQDRLAGIVCGAGYSFDDLQAYAKSMEFWTNDLGGFDEIPTPVAVKLVEARKGLLTALENGKGGAK